MTALDTTKGDAEFTAFMGQVAPSLLRTAWLLTGDAGRAQDLVQEALVRTCRAWPRVRQEDGLGWARGVLVNLRVDGPRHAAHQVDAPALVATAVAAPPPAPRRCDEIVRLLQRLPARDRRVLVLRYGVGLPERSVADLLDLPLGAVRSTASRAALRLVAATRPVGRPGALREGHMGDEDVRRALAAAAEPPLTIDPDTVLHRGHRQARAFRAARATSWAVLTTVAAAIAVAAVLLGPSRQVNGGPDLTGRPPVSTGLVLGGMRFAVSIGFDPRDSNLDFYQVDSSGHRQRLWGRSTEGLGDGATFGNAGPSGAILGVVPSDAVSVSALLLGRPRSASVVAVAPLPGTAYEAVGVLPQDPTLTSRFLGVGWVDDRGLRSTSVPSSDTVATFSLTGSGNQVSVWTDVPGRTWGVFLGDAAQTADLPLAIGSREVTWPSLPDRIRDDPSHPDDGFAYGLLPEGATDVWFTLAPGARASGTVETRALPGAHLTAFVLELDRPTGAVDGRQLRALSWANPDGTRSEHTFPVSAGHPAYRG